MISGVNPVMTLASAILHTLVLMTVTSLGVEKEEGNGVQNFVDKYNRLADCRPRFRFQS
jgi:hypothetical protein